MAVKTPTYTLKTYQDVVVKISGAAGDTATIALADLVADKQVIEDRVGVPGPKVDIAGVTWTGHYDAVTTISRNNVVIMTLPSTGATYLNFNGQDMPTDNTENTHDLAISIVGGQAEIWLRLRKISGYRSTVEIEDFSVYDNPLLAGE